MIAEEKLKEYVIDCRRKVKEEKQLQKLHKPNDVASQIILGAKAKAFQQVLDKMHSIEQEGAFGDWRDEILNDIRERAKVMKEIGRWAEATEKVHPIIL